MLKASLVWSSLFLMGLPATAHALEWVPGNGGFLRSKLCAERFKSGSEWYLREMAGTFLRV